MNKEANIVYLGCSSELEYEVLRTTRVEDWTDFIAFSSPEFRFLIRDHWYTKDDIIRTRPDGTLKISFEIGPEEMPEQFHKLWDGNSFD